MINQHALQVLRDVRDRLANPSDRDDRSAVQTVAAKGRVLARFGPVFAFANVGNLPTSRHAAARHPEPMKMGPRLFMIGGTPRP